MDVPASHDPLVVASSRPLPAARDNLLRTKAVEPERFARLTRRPMAGTAAHADLALALGDHRAAVESYQNQLRVKAEDLESWVGLGLAMRAQGHIRPAAALLEWPELTLAVYQRIRRPEGRTPDPAEFVHWLGRAS